jgi:hypothetical protein
MKSIFTTKRIATGLVIVLLVSVWVLLPREVGQSQLSNNVKARSVAVSSEVKQATQRVEAAFAGSIESEVVQIATPSAVAEPLTPVADVNPDAQKKKVGKVKITQDTLDRITRGKESLVAVPLFDGEVIQVQLEERQPLGSVGTLVYGKVQGELNSRVHFSIVKHAMVASFILEDGREFKMSSMPQGKHEYQLAEIDTIAMLRHQKFPGVPGPVHTGYVNGEKVIALPSYVVAIPKNQMPLRKMLGEEVWDREMKVVVIEPGHDGLINRVKLRRPYGEAGRPDNTQSSEKTPSGLMASTTQQAQVQPAGVWGGGWTINKSGQWQKKPVVGQRGSGGGVSVGFWYTPKVETLFGDAAKVEAEAGTRIAAANQANKDSGLSFSFGMAGSAYRISKEFDGTQINASLDYITPWKNNDTAVNKALNQQRDSSKADLVTVMIDGTKTAGVAGLAWLLQDIKGKETHAYNSIVHKSVPANVAWDHKTWAHEAGHNMGLGHDAAQGAKGILANSWGNHFMSNGKGYHTIMAYPKAPYSNTALVWAGPNVDYNGTKSGSAAADAVGTLRQTSVPIMSYR